MTITPSLTAPAHAAMATGAKPHQTGIVSNQWHETNKTLKNENSGFQEESKSLPYGKIQRMNFEEISSKRYGPDWFA